VRQILSDGCRWKSVQEYSHVQGAEGIKEDPPVAQGIEKADLIGFRNGGPSDRGGRSGLGRAGGSDWATRTAPRRRLKRGPSEVPVSTPPGTERRPLRTGAPFVAS
jgi:hypothetical protein